MNSAKTTRDGRSKSILRGWTRRAWLAAAVSGSLQVARCRGDDERAQLAAQYERFFPPRARRAVEKGLEYLKSIQNEDGSFGRSELSRNVAVCSLAGMTFLASGSLPHRGPHALSLSRVSRFVLNACQSSGFITNSHAAPRGGMYGHGFATLFLAELYGTLIDAQLRPKLARAVDLIVRTQNGEGGWRYQAIRSEADLSVTVCQVMALRAARNAGIYVPNQTIDAATGYVKRCQNEDGGFRYILSQPEQSQFPRSAAAVVALTSAGIYQGNEIDRGLRYLMQFPPRSDSRGRQDYFAYGHYYAVQAMWHAGGTYWESWYPAIRDVLIRLQQEDGSWFDVNSEAYGTAMSTLVLQMPRNYLPIFRR